MGDRDRGREDRQTSRQTDGLTDPPDLWASWGRHQEWGRSQEAQGGRGESSATEANLPDP